TRVIPAATRRAVIARDRHCVVAGCGRSPRWCDVHHIIHWADGGETILSNLCLLCRYHHTLIHDNEEAEELLIAQLELVGAGRRRPI
ncbi:MAG: HNH endonuclease signature motif containing protein, partial [Actinomycetota bacterium]|nr:HNH endonuclease signature motif containing protein [Actinomycetota bacterium]